MAYPGGGSTSPVGEEYAVMRTVQPSVRPATLMAGQVVVRGQALIAVHAVGGSRRWTSRAEHP
jgi:hypothetical protein